MAGWAPMGAGAGFHDTLYEGIEPWMEAPLATWFAKHMKYSAAARAYDSAARNPEPIGDIAREGYAALRGYVDGEELISFLDYCVYLLSSERGHFWANTSAAEHSLATLKAVLELNGSAWTVGTRDGLPGLERRVPEGVQQAADEVMASTGSAGQLLSEAWHAAFGRRPDPEEAYEKAIKAVEEAGTAAVLPKTDRGTLGTMIPTMEAQKWETVLADRQGVPFHGTVVNMCKSLWSAQCSRHGGNNYRKPTQEEAEAAVMLAVPLVHWFHAGQLARR